MPDPERLGAAVRGLLGLALVARPGAVLSGVDACESDEATLAAARALGVRHVVESIALLVRPSRRLQSIVANADAIHALSMVGLAVASPRRRRAALVSATTAATLGAATFVGRPSAPASRRAT